MSKLSAGREASPGHGVHRYERHRPEQTLLYQLVERHYPAFVAQLATQGTPLPEYVRREFEEMGIPFTDLVVLGRTGGADDQAVRHRLDRDGLLGEPVEEQSTGL